MFLAMDKRSFVIMRMKDFDRGEYGSYLERLDNMDWCYFVMEFNET